MPRERSKFPTPLWSWERRTGFRLYELARAFDPVKEITLHLLPNDHPEAWAAPVTSNRSLVYGKSIRRDQIEGDIGEITKRLSPAPNFMAFAAAMFRQAWNAREAQASDAVAAIKRQITGLDRQIEKTLDRIMEAPNATVIRTYEGKIDRLERDKAILAEKATNAVVPRGTFEENLEPVLTFLVSSGKIWET